MKFGIFYEISVPRPWEQESEVTVYDRCLEQVRLADELGFEQVWAVEHHFLEEHSHCSAPDMFLTACAMQTKNIRLGNGIFVCVPEFNHPARLAERAATLDVLSHGRAEFGTGRSTTWSEVEGFRASPEDTKKSWDEYVRVIPQMWMQERFGFEGQYFSMPKRAVLPKPYQKPHPPMWVSVTSPGTEIDAAERGLGGLFLTFGGYGQQEERIATYRNRIVDCEPVGAFVNNQVALVNFLFCHEDAKIGAEKGQRLANTYTYVAGQILSVREVFPTQSYPSGAPQWKLRAQLTGAGGDSPAKVPEGLCVGDPASIIEAIKGWEAIGVDRINFLLNVVETIPQEEVLASMRLFAKEVMPHFREKAAVPATAAVGGVA